MAEKRGSRFTLNAKVATLSAALLAGAFLLNAMWSNSTQEAQAERELLEKAQIMTSQMMAVWEFMDVNQDRIDTDSDGTYNFKGVYCAIAGKSIAAFFGRDTDYIIRYVNVSPRKKSATPDAFEAEAFATFEAGGTEHYGLTTYQSSQVFRYVSPVYIKESCLDCHGGPAGETDVTGYPKEGWKEGDIGGATSIIMPVDLYLQGIQNNIAQQVGYFLAIFAAIVAFLYIAVNRLFIRPLTTLKTATARMEGGNLDVDLSAVKGAGDIEELTEQFQAMASRLRDTYAGLESQVAVRTEQLRQANELLEEQHRQLLAANERLQEDYQYQSDFFAIMSHELRTPLTAIIAFAELWEQSGKGAEDSLEVKEIRENGEILLQMVNNILEMARMDAGRSELKIEPVDLVDLVGTVKATAGFLAERRSIALTSSVGTDVPIISADWEKLRRILENLVSNAIKFTKQSGKVSIDIGFESETNQVAMRVADDGIGIKPDHLPHLFEKYSQYSHSSQRRYKGSGLGLAVVKELVVMHKGTIEVQSEYKRGSAFTVRLPVGDYDWSSYGKDNDR